MVGRNGSVAALLWSCSGDGRLAVGWLGGGRKTEFFLTESEAELDFSDGTPIL